MKSPMILFNKPLEVIIAKIKNDLGIPIEDISFDFGKEQITLLVEDRETEYHEGGYGLHVICIINKKGEFTDFEMNENLMLNRERGYHLPLRIYDYKYCCKKCGGYSLPTKEFADDQNEVNKRGKETILIVKFTDFQKCKDCGHLLKNEYKL